MIYNIKRWFVNWNAIVVDFVSYIGLFWLFVEMASYSSNSKADDYLKNLCVFLIVALLILLISLIKNKPKSTFSYKLRDKDNFIEVKVGDAFKNDGSLVIPINSHFDVSLGGNVQKSNSLQKRLINKYYGGKEEHLELDISSKVDLTASPHDIGTTAEVEQGGKVFYLLANSRKNENNRAISSIDDLLFSLAKLWENITTDSDRNSVITIPLIGTNHGRLKDINRENVAKEIIESYIEASKHMNIADKLIISIHPNDIKKGNIDLDGLDEFLRFSCEHYKIVTFSNKQEGEAESPSSIESVTR